MLTGILGLIVYIIIPIIIINRIVKMVGKASNIREQKKLQKRIDEKNKKTIELNIEVVEKGVEVYKDLIALIERNIKFRDSVCSRYPHFIIRQHNIMIAIPIASSSDTVHYFEEVYNKIKEEEKGLCNYWVENISDCEELCSWLISDDCIQDYGHGYAVVRTIGMLRKTDDSEYVLDGGTIVEEILKRI